MTLVLVMLGGAFGAVVRYAVDQWTPAWKLPLATLAVNVTGSLLLGLLAGLAGALTGPLGALLGTGFCGALTTWSTLAFQAVTLPRRTAAIYLGVTLVLGLTAAWLGQTLVSR